MRNEYLTSRVSDLEMFDSIIVTTIKGEIFYGLFVGGNADVVHESENVIHLQFFAVGISNNKGKVFNDIRNVYTVWMSRIVLTEKITYKNYAKMGY